LFLPLGFIMCGTVSYELLTVLIFGPSEAALVIAPFLFNKPFAFSKIDFKSSSLMISFGMFNASASTGTETWLSTWNKCDNKS